MIYPGDIWLVRRRWFGGRFAADNIGTLRSLARGGFLRPKDRVCAPGDAARTIDEKSKWQKARQIRELAVEFEIFAPALLSPRVRRAATYLLSTLIGLSFAVLAAVVLKGALANDRKFAAAIILLSVFILHAVRRGELAVIRSRFEAAFQHQVVFHLIKDGREPTRDELLLELATWNHTIGCRETVYEIQTVLELVVALIAVANLL